MATVEPNSRHLTLPIVVTGAVGELLLYVSPLLLGAITEGFGATEGNAGLLVAAELSASALLAFLFARRLSALNARILVVGAVCAMVAADAISAFSSSLIVLIVCRILAGGGSGTLLACANSMAASGRGPQKIFALLTLAAVTGAFIAYWLVPFAIDRFGPRGAFIALATLTAVNLPFAFWFPSKGIHSETDLKAAATQFGAAGWSLMFAMGVLYLGQNALWAYVERIAHAAGLPLSTVSKVLMANSVLALGAPLLAQGWGLRTGLLGPIVVGMGVQITAALLLPHSRGVVDFGTYAILFTFGFMFVVPYMKTQMARLDGTGRLSGSAMAFVTVGSATGPALAGIALNGRGDYLTVGWIAAVSIGTSTALTCLGRVGRME